MKSNVGLVRLLKDNLHIVRERDKLRKAQQGAYVHYTRCRKLYMPHDTILKIILVSVSNMECMRLYFPNFQVLMKLPSSGWGWFTHTHSRTYAHTQSFTNIGRCLGRIDILPTQLTQALSQARQQHLYIIPLERYIGQTHQSYDSSTSLTTSDFHF